MSDLAKWANDQKVTFPVMADPNWQVCDPLLSFGYIPSYVLIDQNLVIQKKGLYMGMFHTKIKSLLGMD